MTTAAAGMDDRGPGGPPVIDDAAQRVRAAVDAVYRSESRRVLATLIRLLGDFDLAEEALHDAFAAAVEQWPRDGVPANPRAWLVSAGRFKAIDAMRRRARFDASLADIAAAARRRRTRRSGDREDRRRRGRPAAPDLHLLPSRPAARCPGRADPARGLRPDHRGDRARLPHRRRPPWPSASCAPRRRSATPRIPYQVPSLAELPDRLDTVLQVIYLVFNEGYSASSGESLTRPDLSERGHPPRPPARRAAAGTRGRRPAGADAAARIAPRRAQPPPTGDLILLEEQDRSLWNREQIAEGAALVERALAVAPVRPLHPPGRHRRGACRGPHRRRHGLGADRRRCTTCWSAPNPPPSSS